MCPLSTRHLFLQLFGLVLVRAVQQTGRPPYGCWGCTDTDDESDTPVHLYKGMCWRQIHTPTENCTLISQLLCDGLRMYPGEGGPRDHFKKLDLWERAREGWQGLANELHGNEESIRAAKEFPRAPRQCLALQETCAIVASSSHLMNGTFGPDIDRHDLVIRINAAPSGRAKPEWAPYVGTKSDVRFLNQFASAPSDESDLNACVFLHEPKTPAACGSGCWLGSSAKSCKTEDPECIGNWSTFNYCRGHMQTVGKNWGKRTVILDHVHSGMAFKLAPPGDFPTAGLKALVYSLHHCRHVSLFGFGPSCDGDVGARYYVNNVAVDRGQHHYSDELKLMLKMEGDSSKDPRSVVMNPELKDWIYAESVKLHWPKCLAANMTRDADHAFLKRLAPTLGVKLTVDR